jgi:hypothetical protein
LGPDIPPELVTYYAGLGRTIVFAQLYEYTATFYFYEGMVTTPGGNKFLVQGHTLAGVPSGDSYVFFDGAISRTVYGIGTGADVDFIQIGDDTTDVAIAIDAGAGQLFIGDTGAGGIFIEPGTGTVSISIAGGDWTLYDGSTTVSLPRGFCTGAAGQSDSAAVGAEAVVLTADSFDFKAGRAYKFAYGGWVTASTANTTTFRIRKDTVTGNTEVGTQNYSGATSARQMNAEVVLRCTADVTVTFVLTMEASTGTSTQNGSSTRPRFLEIVDVGEANAYADWPAFA